jgi:S-adenosylmethionine:diacylglycerol 3-amino-3-carboxypropyl transferase
MAQSQSAEPTDFRPVYSEVMEDYSVISDALGIEQSEIAVVVASAGDNVFNAALERARHIFGVDINPLQIDFCRLKEAAIATLSWDELAELMGVVEATPERRLELLGQLPVESPVAELRRPGIADLFTEQGLAGSGQLSAFVAPLRQGLQSIVGSDTLERMLTEPDRNERERLWQQRFGSEEVLGFLGAALNEQTISGAFIPAWAFPRMAEKPFHVFYHRILKQRLVDTDPTSNFFMHRLWRGRFPSSEDLPPYLQRRNHALLRENLDRITWHSADLCTFLRTLPTSSLQAFNLSNILDWSDEEPYQKLWEEIDRVAAPNARVFLRSFLSDRALPTTVAGRWKLAADRSSRIARAERVGYYSRYELWVRSH